MPYIASKMRRMELNEIVDLMYEKDVKADGDLAYLLFKYAKEHVPNKYNKIKNYRGELVETADEIRRRIMDPREDQALKENGDV